MSRKPKFVYYYIVIIIIIRTFVNPEAAVAIWKGRDFGV